MSTRLVPFPTGSIRRRGLGRHLAALSEFQEKTNSNQQRLFWNETDVLRRQDVDVAFHNTFSFQYLKSKSDLLPLVQQKRYLTSGKIEPGGSNSKLDLSEAPSPPRSSQTSAIGPQMTQDPIDPLLDAAEEADRLTTLAKTSFEDDATEEESSADQTFTFSKPKTPSIKVRQRAMSNALDAARTLLLVSSPSVIAEEILYMRAPPKQRASLHRAFLLVTSWCLDIVLAEQDHQQQQRESYRHQTNTLCREEIEGDSLGAILDATVSLARRAHVLSLPYHLPLYQRLIQAISQHCHNEKENSWIENHFSEQKRQTGAILEILSCVADLLEEGRQTVEALANNVTRLLSERDSLGMGAFIFPALTRMIQYRQFYSLIQVLSWIHDEGYCFDLRFSVELLLTLRKETKEIVRDETARLSYYESDLLDVVCLLEQLVLRRLILTQHDPEILHEEIRSLVEEVDDGAAEAAALGEILRLFGSDPDNCDTEESSNIYLESEDHMSEMPNRGVDPLDTAVDSILIRGMSNGEARELLVELMGILRSREEVNRSKGVAMVGLVNDGELVVYATSSRDRPREEDDDSVTTQRGNEYPNDRGELIYSRGNDYDCIPDVTAQLVSLNCGEAVFFSKEYEDLVWARDYEDDFTSEEFLGDGSHTDTDWDDSDEDE